MTLADESHAIMIDGFFSRPGKTKLLLGWAGLRTIDSNDRRLVDAKARLAGQPVHAIFVTHAHHDHALDSAQIAAHKNAVVYGSTSTMQVIAGALSGLSKPVTQVVVKNQEVVCIGQFRITVIDSPHDTTRFGPGGEIKSPLRRPAALGDFKSGPSHAYYIEHPNGHVLIVPSPIQDPNFKLRKPAAPDVVLLGIGMLGREPESTIEAYWNTTVDPVRTKQVHPIHWDDFTAPISKRPPAFPFSGARRAGEVLGSFAVGKELSLLPALEPIRLPAFPRETRLGGACTHAIF